MAAPLSLASVVEKNRIDSDVPFVVALDIEIVSPQTGEVVETARVVNNPESITHMGNVYEPASFDLQLSEESGTQPDVSLTINDYTQAIQARMQEYGGGMGFNVTISVLDASALDRPAELVQFFEVVGASAGEFMVTWKLGAANGLANTFPRRRQTKDFCQWRFKDGETCRYKAESGIGDPDVCDLTLQGPKGCASHGNTINFGGFPGIMSNGVRYA